MVAFGRMCGRESPGFPQDHLRAQKLDRFQQNFSLTNFMRIRSFSDSRFVIGHSRTDRNGKAIRCGSVASIPTCLERYIRRLVIKCALMLKEIINYYKVKKTGSMITIWSMYTQSGEFIAMSVVFLCS